MENASQALIIAGAILLAILIIALGMFVFQTASKRITDGANRIGREAVQTQNAIYQQYMDKRIKGSDVKTFLESVRISVENSDAKKATSLIIDLGTGAQEPNLVSGATGVAEAKDDDTNNTYSKEINNLKSKVRSNENYKIVENIEQPDSHTKEGLIKRVLLQNAN